MRSRNDARMITGDYSIITRGVPGPAPGMKRGALAPRTEYMDRLSHDLLRSRLQETEKTLAEGLRVLIRPLTYVLLRN